ncbi:MAG: methyltransferase [Desulfovibrionaceae bacterium]
MPNKTASPDDIRALSSAFQQSRILLTAADLDLFTHLGRATRSAAELSPLIKADERALDRLLNALTALGLATKQGNAFTATDAAHALLSRESPDYIALGHRSNLYANWNTLTQAVRTGMSVLTPDFDDDSRREDFIAAMHNRGGVDADGLAARLPLAGLKRVLDVGGGSGVYAMGMCRAEPGLEVVVLELPKVVPITARYVAEAGLSDRITTKAGNFNSDDWGAGYDLVLLSAIVHMLGPEENARLLERAFAALAPGGWCAVVDFLMDDSRTRPAFGAVFALNMLVNTARGDVYTRAEARDWFTHAGFVALQDIDTGPKTSMVLGRKPGGGE